MTEELIQKYNNHRQKADGYNVDTISGLYDKYSTTYTGYNMLYNEVPASLAKQNVKLRAKDDDNHKATDLVAQYLGEENIYNQFLEWGNEKDIHSLIWIIEEGYFNIVLDRAGNSKSERDKELLLGLKSESSDVKIMAILKIIYAVRNNMVHGNKDIQEYQRFLLEPLLSLLQTLCSQLFEKLGA
ncbi:MULTISPECIES: hypothetical protein [Mucilaginibacter]|jgi:hypothetical protein|uniref:Apea-like HEPN domain-containing protein n=2 Tax=Mucilaginibacter TaxID=423349 RepID=A0A6I4I6C8_9SPHI|nr:MULTISPECIES: hypothetical protein [Mucilaginibacter]NCD68850.1 hypothetical protein [Mucilaginibacter agri]QQL50564.1 hypothetical protein GO620_003670 [Mucilaginibacter ginkgonis]